jgi:hypothetical protein
MWRDLGAIRLRALGSAAGHSRAADARGAGPATTPHPAAYPARAWEELSSKCTARLLNGGARRWEWDAL